MQWSCPHCGVTLAVPFDTLGTGWSFSRCYKCGGFALIRRAEVNIIKVDKAPPGEKVILPEAGTDLGAGMLSEEAAQKLAKHQSKVKPPEKPTVRPATRAVTPPPPPPTTSQQRFDDLEQVSLESTLFEKDFSEIKSEEEFEKTSGKRTIPFGLIIGLCSISSGIYLYVQSQNVIQKVKDTGSDSHVSSAQHAPTAMRETNSNHHSAESSPPFASKNLVESNLAISNTDADNYQPLPEQQIIASHKDSRRVITDQVQESAMAPLKPLLTTIPTSSSAMLVQTRLKRVSVHEGPGMQFPVTGLANPNIRYVVADWKDRWFKIALNTGGALNDVGWIRNDLVQVMPPSALLGNTVPDVNPFRR